MTISAKVIADSIYNGGPRLTTFVLRYPRFIHSEFLTHRVFSRNAASSRAIPVKKMIEAIQTDPAMPVFWGKNQSGMQAAEELGMTSIDLCKGTWLAARDRAIEFAESMMQFGLHKQIANRVLEPWMHIEVVATATDFANFYGLRDHPMAQPEFQDLARKMKAAQRESEPQVLDRGDWHLPFIEDEDVSRAWDQGRVQYGDRKGIHQAFVQPLLCKISAARCARVSYLKHDGGAATIEEDMALFDRLMGGNPKHASPTEHQARAPQCLHDFDEEEHPASDYVWNGPLQQTHKYPSNLRGWTQFRKLISGEVISE